MKNNCNVIEWCNNTHSGRHVPAIKRALVLQTLLMVTVTGCHKCSTVSRNCTSCSRISAAPLYNVTAQVFRFTEVMCLCRFSSRFFEEFPAVVGFAYQEPENDPRHFGYLWVARGPTAVQSMYV